MTSMERLNARRPFNPEGKRREYGLRGERSRRPDEYCLCVQTGIWYVLQTPGETRGRVRPHRAGIAAEPRGYPWGIQILRQAGRGGIESSGGAPRNGGTFTHFVSSCH